MQHIVNFIKESYNSADEYFKAQDKFKEKMINTWKSNKYEELKQFDLYFEWKSGKINCNEFKSHKKEIRKMWDSSEDLLNDLYDSKSKDNDLIEILQGINAELETIYQMIY